MTFEVGAVLEDEKWQAPVYCFDGKGGGANNGVLHQNFPVMDGVLRGSLFPAI